MPHADSNDLCSKLLEAHDQGDGSLKVLAARFSVSEDFAYKLSSARRRTWSMDRQPQRRQVSQVDTGQITVLLNGQPGHDSARAAAGNGVIEHDRLVLDIESVVLAACLDRSGVHLPADTGVYGELAVDVEVVLEVESISWSW